MEARRDRRRLVARAAEHEARLASWEIPEGSVRRYEGSVDVLGPARVQPVHAERIERAIASWNSFLGHLRFGRAQTAAVRALGRATETAELARVRMGERSRVSRRFPLPKLDANIGAQLRRLRRGVAPAALVVQRGRLFEFDRVRLALSLGLRRFRVREGRRRVTATRAELMRAVALGLTRGMRFAIALERRSRGTNPRWRELRFVIGPNEVSACASA